MVTIYDIAKRCGVSPSTVSKVINNYHSIPDDTRKKVLKTMNEMNYIPNSQAKFLSKGSSNNVGILAYFGMDISPFKHTLFTEILDSFQNEMNKNKYDLLFISRIAGGKDESFYKNCVSRNVDGLLLFGDLNCEEMSEVLKSNIPSIGFDYFGENSDGVSTDNFEKTKLLTNHLISLGHRNIVYICGEHSTFVTTDRINGFKAALEEHDIEFKEDMLVSSKYIDTNSVEEITCQLLQRKNRPTAIMYPDDYSAISGIQTLKKLGFNCPNDISITGFDGLAISQMISPRLTTVKQDTVNIGITLAKQLIKTMQTKKKGNSHIVVPGSIIYGESTKRIN